MLNGQRTKNENCDNLLILILFQTCMNSSFSAEQNNEILQIFQKTTRYLPYLT